jgi:hypothetical protein
VAAARACSNPKPPRRAFEIILKDRAAFHPSAVIALVRITRDKSGRHLERDDQFLIDLSDNRKLEVADFLSVNVGPNGEPERAAGGGDGGDDGPPRTVDDVLSDNVI